MKGLAFPHLFHPAPNSIQLKILRHQQRRALTPASTISVVLTPRPNFSSTLNQSPSHFEMNSLSHRHPMEATVAAVIRLKPIEATPESFQEFGQVIEASPDGDEFGPGDAQLDLSRGIPRFYIMHIEDRPLKFSTITHHASVTQCLGSIGALVWYLGVAKPSILDPTIIEGADVVKSRCGHFYAPPRPEDVRVFKISGPKFLKLNLCTWHAGPLFLEKAMDFYNLELSNTNVVDHTTHDFVKKNNVKFAFDE